MLEISDKAFNSSSSMFSTAILILSQIFLPEGPYDFIYDSLALKASI